MTAVTVPKAKPGVTPAMVELTVVGTTTTINALPVATFPASAVNNSGPLPYLHMQ